jgi:Na+/H+-dicarboxylate symporter
MNHDQVMQSMLQSYSLIFAWVAAALLSYIVFLYSFANGFNLQKALSCLKNILPAAATGFGAMSSAAAMPLTILGAEKNAKDKSLAASFIPATVNVHLIGDCFAIPIFAFAILKSFGLPDPSLSSYLIFASYFVLAKFSVAAVPGGGILVMLPILEAYLGFNTEMLTLITALYLLFDPVITAANILGNGAFALILEKLVAFKPKEVATDEP